MALTAKESKAVWEHSEKRCIIESHVRESTDVSNLNKFLDSHANTFVPFREDESLPDYRP